VQTKREGAEVVVLELELDCIMAIMVQQLEERALVESRMTSLTNDAAVKASKTDGKRLYSCISSHKTCPL